MRKFEKTPLTDEQTEALVREIVDGWDLETLIQFAIDDLYALYRQDSEMAIDAMVDHDLRREDLDEAFKEWWSGQSETPNK